jgi:hypothetical protein
MIKVYVFVTGLVLYQFSTTSGEPARAILAAGGYEYEPLGAVVIEHHPQVRIGSKDKASVTHTSPFVWRFDVNCDGCQAIIDSPPELLDLAEVANDPKVRPACWADPSLGDRVDTLNEQCLAPGTTKPAAAGVLEFSGPWRAVSMTDCGKNTYPVGFDALDYFTWVHARKSWTLIVEADKRPGPTPNSVLFTTEVASLNDLAVSDTATGTVFKKLLGAKECALLPGFTTSMATDCVAMIVRIGPGQADMAKGGGDLHFAGLYTLLGAPPVADKTWLPIATVPGSCSHGGGTGGGSHCVGGKVVY